MLLGPAFFLCLPLCPRSTASLTAGPPHPHRLLHVLRVGLFLILPASVCSNLAWPSHLCSDVTTAIRPFLCCWFLRTFFSPSVLVSLHLASAVLSTQEALPPEKRHLQSLPYLANTWLLCCYSRTFVWRVLLMCVEMVDTRRQAYDSSNIPLDNAVSKMLCIQGSFPGKLWGVTGQTSERYLAVA